MLDEEGQNMSEYRVISSDNHVFEPPDLWTSRIEPRFRDKAPRLEHEEDGYWWYCGDHRLIGLGPGAQTGKRFEETRRTRPTKISLTDTFENLRPGGYIPEEHVKDMAADGVDMSILYPTVGLPLFHVNESEALTAIFRAYNDWLAEFCQTAPDRLKGIAMLNVDDVQDGIDELTRCAKIGMAGAMITTYPHEDHSYDSPEYEPLWATAEDLGMPLSLHLGTSRPGPGQDRKGNSLGGGEVLKPASMCNLDHWTRLSVAHIIFSGVFERYPKLQIGAVENELSWTLFWLDRMDYTYTQRVGRPYWYNFKEDMLPSDYFHRNVFVGFQEDALGIRNRDIIGVDNIQWGSDYPHQESTFPRSQQILEEILADCTEEEKAKITGGNAARVYGF